jgi:acetyl esterase/lipase
VGDPLHIERSDGEPVAVSGLVIAPEGAARTRRPVISWAHYSVGLSDDCAPSRAGLSEDLTAIARPFTDAGFVFAATDYAGLGTPGLNPYYMGRSAGADVLDIGRAAARLPETGATNEIGLLGESQGGHAVLWAAELAATHAPEVDLVGVVASSTVADVTAMMDRIRQPDRWEVGWVAGLQIVWVWHQLLGLPIGGVIDDADRAIASRFESKCPGFTEFPDEQPLLVDLAEIPAWQRAMVENTPGHAAIAVPILLEHGTADNFDMAEAVLERLCTVGDTVEFVSLPGAGHLEPLHRPGRLEEIAEWLHERRAGEPAASAC